MITAIAPAMPAVVDSARSGRRSMLRIVIRIAGDHTRPQPRRSKSVGRYRPGDGGRIASAGTIVTARRTAEYVPANAAPIVTADATTTTQAGNTKRYEGKRKNCA
jgi:hypothetical protein